MKFGSKKEIWIDLHYWNNIKKNIPFQNGGQKNFFDIAQQY